MVEYKRHSRDPTGKVTSDVVATSLKDVINGDETLKTTYLKEALIQFGIQGYLRASED
jgi:hypothetical protein